MNVQRRLKEIMAEDVAQVREADLRILARKMGCSSAFVYDRGSGCRQFHEEEVVRRIQEAARGIRETRLWWIALFSAIASGISALAAWTAVGLLD